jgi:hypothetical protein
LVQGVFVSQFASSVFRHSTKRDLEQQLAGLEPLIASKKVRSPWAIYKGDNLTSDQIDHLISLGALNRDEVIIAKVNQPDNFRLFPKAVVAMLVDFGVFLP